MQGNNFSPTAIFSALLGMAVCPFFALSFRSTPVDCQEVRSAMHGLPPHYLSNCFRSKDLK